MAKSFRLQRIVSGPHKGKVAVFDEGIMLGVGDWDPDDQENNSVGADNPPPGAGIDQVNRNIADGLAAAKKAAGWNKKNEKPEAKLSETGSHAQVRLARAVNSYLREHRGVAISEAIGRVTRVRPELWEDYLSIF